MKSIIFQAIEKFASYVNGNKPVIPMSMGDGKIEVGPSFLLAYHESKRKDLNEKWNGVLDAVKVNQFIKFFLFCLTEDERVTLMEYILDKKQ